MKIRSRKSCGFTLLEVLFASVLVAGAFASLMAILQVSNKTRTQGEIRQEAAVYAHARALLFSRGVIYPEVFAFVPGQKEIHEMELEKLPGGFPVHTATETVELSGDGKTGFLTIKYEIESASENLLRFEATMSRHR